MGASSSLARCADGEGGGRCGVGGGLEAEVEEIDSFSSSNNKNNNNNHKNSSNNNNSNNKSNSNNNNRMAISSERRGGDSSSSEVSSAELGLGTKLPRLTRGTFCQSDRGPEDSSASLAAKTQTSKGLESGKSMLVEPRSSLAASSAAESRPAARLSSSGALPYGASYAAEGATLLPLCGGEASSSSSSSAPPGPCTTCRAAKTTTAAVTTTATAATTAATAATTIAATTATTTPTTRPTTTTPPATTTTTATATTTATTAPTPTTTPPTTTTTPPTTPTIITTAPPPLVLPDGSRSGSSSAPRVRPSARRAKRGSAEGYNLLLLAERLQPVFFELAEFLLERPQDFPRLYNVSASVAFELEPRVQHFWQVLYRQRWPAFFDSLEYHGATSSTASYRRLYREMLATAAAGERGGQGGRGKEVLLEIFDREKKLGFSMACMPAKVQYDSSLDSYVVRYISATQVTPEIIPREQEHRLRFCPPSARQRLRPCAAAPTAPAPPKQEGSAPEKQGSEGYPYKVLEGLDGLEAGVDVELQWKMQPGSPFGWWFGHLEALVRSANGVTAVATVIFRHFPSTSRWHRLELQVGGPEVRLCNFGGFSGGLRAVSAAERELRWMRFFPEKTVVV